MIERLFKKYIDRKVREELMKIEQERKDRLEMEAEVKELNEKLAQRLYDEGLLFPERQRF